MLHAVVLIGRPILGDSGLIASVPAFQLNSRFFALEKPSGIGVVADEHENRKKYSHFRSLQVGEIPDIGRGDG